MRHASSAALPVDKSHKRTLTLSRAQRRKIYFDVTKLDGSEVAFPAFVPKIGETVPGGVKISPLPARTVRLAAMLKSYQYAIPAMRFASVDTNWIALPWSVAMQYRA
jgi:hypothetical protein